MRSCATDLIRLKTSLLILLGGSVIGFAQDQNSICRLPGTATVTCEKGQQCHSIPKGNGTWDVECVTVSPSDKAGDESLREQQFPIPKGISLNYSATVRFLASSPYGSQTFYCWPSGSFAQLNWKAEEGKWRRKVAEEPNDLMNHFYLGRGLIGNNKLVEAENEFRFILDREPLSPQSAASTSALRGLGVD